LGKLKGRPETGAVQGRGDPAERILRLGGLSEEELAFEFSDRLKSVGLLKALAKTNAIPFSKETSKEKLIELITHYARRAHSNIRHRA
jgi:hypothetical protein